ncbi:MAG TPA: FAD-dependent oxidoreductase, partial [Gammaproteobacteria bacterium]|nr:FAD-dependent oxidoreductase [Gammaproteobacteria bacterium]
MNTKDISLDIVIFGGGIAGLWTLNQLRRLGYQAILLETHTLGGGQTIKSQGIIHGGMKYALSGFLSGSANTIETMPQRWKDALAGAGELDLSTVNVLSEDQLLWSTGSLGSEVASFFASKALNSRIQKLPKTAYPSILKNSLFKGHAYRLEEVVLDMPSLIETLTKPH